MSSVHYSARDKRSLKELPILEDTDARKVIVLSPRGGLKLRLGCAVSLFIPAGVLLLVLVSMRDPTEALWLLGTLFLVTIAVPFWVIWWSRSWLDTEHFLILEPDRVTLRTRSFDQTTNELVEVNDETVEIGPGSGLTSDDTVLKEHDNSISITVWGPTESLSLSASHAEFPWLRQQIQDWLQRKVFTSGEAASHHSLNPPHAHSVGNLDAERMSMPSSKSSTRGKTTRLKRSSPEGLVTIVEENASELHLRIATRGPAATAFGWNSLGQFLFVTAFSLFWYFVGSDMGWTPLVICGALWLVTVVVIGVAIRRLFEAVDLELSQKCLIVIRTILGWRRIQRVKHGATPSVQLMVTQWSGSTPQPTLCVKGSDDEVRFGTMLSDDEKRWLVMRLRAFLKLDLRANIFAEPEGQADS